jgi:4a-hydroxytetrahydrobiopterin dehydratase
VLSESFAIFVACKEECGMRRAKHKLIKGILLTEDDLRKSTEKLIDWKVEEGKLQRQYSFRSFPEAFAFLAGAALISESMNHSIEWYNLDGLVSVKLRTPAVGGISTIDVLLAERLDELR